MNKTILVDFTNNYEINEFIRKFNENFERLKEENDEEYCKIYHGKFSIVTRNRDNIDKDLLVSFSKNNSILFAESYSKIDLINNELDKILKDLLNLKLVKTESNNLFQAVNCFDSRNSERIDLKINYLNNGESDSSLINLILYLLDKNEGEYDTSFKIQKIDQVTCLDKNKIDKFGNLICRNIETEQCLKLIDEDKFFGKNLVNIIAVEDNIDSTKSLISYKKNDCKKILIDIDIFPFNSHLSKVVGINNILFSVIYLYYISFQLKFGTVKINIFNCKLLNKHNDYFISKPDSENLEEFIWIKYKKPFYINYSTTIDEIFEFINSCEEFSFLKVENKESIKMININGTVTPTILINFQSNICEVDQCILAFYKNMLRENIKINNFEIIFTYLDNLLINDKDNMKLYSFLFLDSTNLSCNYEVSIISAFYVLNDQKKISDGIECEVNLYSDDINEKLNVRLLKESEFYLYGMSSSYLKMENINL